MASVSLDLLTGNPVLSFNENLLRVWIQERCARDCGSRNSQERAIKSH
jgi:hypothetical protein